MITDNKPEATALASSGLMRRFIISPQRYRAIATMP
jgi:hypothetical protein